MYCNSGIIIGLIVVLYIYVCEIHVESTHMVLTTAMSPWNLQGAWRLAGAARTEGINRRTRVWPFVIGR
jgi:hypothetical protein